MTGALLTVAFGSAAAVVLAIAWAERPGRISQLATSETQRWRSPDWFRRCLVASDDLDPDKIWLLWWAGLAASFGIGSWIAGTGLGVLSALSWAALPLVAPRWLSRRAERRRSEAVPEVLDAVARGLRSGASLLQALQEASREEGALREELAVVATDAERGTGVARALDGWAVRQSGGEIRLAATALAMAAEAGGATARTVEGVASTVRQRLAVAGETKALTSQARISAQVMALAPLGFCAIGAATDPALARFLFVTPLGWVFLTVGAALDLVGAMWMQRLAR